MYEICKELKIIRDIHISSFLSLCCVSTICHIISILRLNFSLHHYF